MRDPETIVIKANHPGFLIVEGKDEELFFEALINHENLTGIQVHQLGGKTKLENSLRLIQLSDKFDEIVVIGIVRDADANHKGAFDSICSTLRKVGLDFPKKRNTFSDGLPKIGILTIPSPSLGSNRNLEDLCLASIVNDNALKCVDQYFNCLQVNEIILKDNVISKARLLTFIASRQIPDLRLGEAARKGYFPFDHPAFDTVKAFLQQIAGRM